MESLKRFERKASRREIPYVSTIWSLILSTKERGRKGMQQFFPFAGDLKTISPLSLAYVATGFMS